MDFFTTCAYIGIIVISISMVLALVRFIKGPSLPDRVISLGVFSANLLAVLAIYSILADQKSYLNVALAMSLVAFVGTMTFASCSRYLWTHLSPAPFVFTNSRHDDVCTLFSSVANRRGLGAKWRHAFLQR